jgi:hypothetical protein
MDLNSPQHQTAATHSIACVELYGDVPVVDECTCPALVAPVPLVRSLSPATTPERPVLRTFAQRAGVGSAAAALGAYGVISVLTSPVLIMLVASSTMVGVCIAAWRGVDE